MMPITATAILSFLIWAAFMLAVFKAQSGKMLLVKATCENTERSMMPRRIARVSAILLIVPTLLLTGMVILSDTKGGAPLTDNLSRTMSVIRAPSEDQLPYALNGSVIIVFNKYGNESAGVAKKLKEITNNYPRTYLVEINSRQGRTLIAMYPEITRAPSISYIRNNGTMKSNESLVHSDGSFNQEAFDRKQIDQATDRTAVTDTVTIY